MSRKLYVLFGGALFFALGLTTFGLWGMATSNKMLRSTHVDRVVSLRQLKTIADDYAVLIIDAVNKAQGGRVSASEALEKVRQANERIRKEWRAYMATTLTPREAELAREVELLFGPADKQVAALEAVLAQLSGNEPGRLDAFDGPLYDVIDPISGKLTELVELQLDVAASAYEVASGKLQRIIIAAFAIFVVGGLAFIVVGTLFIRQFVGAMHGVGETLVGGSKQLAAAAERLASSSQTLAEGASEQAASVEEISALLEELSSATKRNADNAETVRQSAMQARVAAEAGAADMLLMQSAMDAIQKSSGDISKIIKTIDEIAFQTNILALNAAVEAARAGAAGAGFAVVADEVRSLAHRSTTAARETADKIAEVLRKSTQGVDLCVRVNGGLGEIMNKVRDVDRSVSEVAGASREQSEGLAQINKAISQMDKVTQHNSASAEESAAAAEGLNAQSVELRSSSARLVSIIDGTQPAV